MLKQRLSTDASLQPLLAQYVPLALDTSDPEFGLWTRQYPPTGNGIPMIFIVSAQGQAVYNRSGAPQGDGLKQLLEQGIAQTGGPKELPSTLSPQAQKQLDQAARRAKAMIAENKLEPAAAAIGAVLKKASQGSPSRESGAEEFKTGHKEFDEAHTMLLAAAQAELEKALKEQLGDSALAAAVALARVKRHFEPLPSMRAEIEQAIAGFSASSPDVWKQAEMIDRADALQESGPARPAIAAYERVIEAYPESDAARLCQERVAELSGPGGANVSKAPATPKAASSGERTWRDATGKFEIVASLVTFDGAIATLKAADGRTIQVPLEKLDGESQKALRQAPIKKR